jgi:hypothetical protein
LTRIIIIEGGMLRLSAHRLAQGFADIARELKQ